MNAAPPIQPSTNLRLLRVSEWLMAACVAAAAALTLFHAATEARLPFQLDYEEGNILNTAVRVDAGQSPYPDPQAFPNALNPYGPVGYGLAALCVRMGGTSFTLPRYANLCCGLVIATLLLLLVSRFTGSVPLAVTFGLYFLGNGVTRTWLPLLRVDMLAIALSLAGLWLCHRSEGRWWFPASVCFTLALFVKYTALAAPAACFLWLLSRRDSRRAILLAGTVCALCLAGFGAMQAVTNGNFFFHMFRTHPDPYTFRRLVGIFLMVEPSVAALAPLLLAFLLLKPHRAPLALFYLMCACLVVSVTGGKAGSFINHFLEPIVACALAAAVGYQALVAMPRPPRLVPLLTLTVGAAALYLTGAFTQDTRVVPLSVTDCGDLYRSVRESKARNVLAENVGTVVLAGRQVWDSNPFVLAQLVRSKALSGAPLEQMVARREFDLIVLNSEPAEMKLNGSQRWWGRIVSAMDENYRVSRVYDCAEANVVVVPRNASGTGYPAPQGH